MAKRKQKRKMHYIYKSAVTGEFVSRRYWERHPKTTIRQRVR